jgi:hypothetical protein
MDYFHLSDSAEFFIQTMEKIQRKGLVLQHCTFLQSQRNMHANRTAYTLDTTLMFIY